MSYLGNSTTFQTVAPGIDYFSGNASTTTFQLSRQIVAVQDILVYIDNVPQNPSTAYSINTATNQITFTSAPLSGTNNIWVYYNTKSIQFLVPSPGTVSNSSLNSGSFSNITGVGTLSSLTVTNDASISGLTVGKGGGAVAGNTAIGNSALYLNSTGNYNTAVGYQAGYTNTTGRIDAFGTYVLQANTTGVSNVGMGGSQIDSISSALRSNTTGSYNTGIGMGALGSNTTASNNTAVGYQAGYSNTTGSVITAFGYQTLYTNSTGTNNAAFGDSALNRNTTGASNNAFGSLTLYFNTTGGANTAMGYQSLFSNTTASYNTAVGFQAGYSNTTGTYNLFLGYQAGYPTTGSYNTFVGSGNGVTGSTGGQVTSGAKNTIIGGYSGNQGGLDIRTASNRIVLSDGDGNPRAYSDDSGNWSLTGGLGVSTGWSAQTGRGINLPGVASSSATINTSVIFFNSYSTSVGLPTFIQNWASTGTFAIGTHSGSNDNIVRIGQATSSGSGFTWNGAYCNVYAGAYTNASDYRIKENVITYGDGALEKVLALRPVTYNIIASKPEEGKEQLISRTEIGFIAHEIQEQVPEVVIGQKDAMNTDGSENHQAVDYSKFTAVLVKAIQELKAEFDAYKATHP